jgi:branched-chain amino acid transport system ATP-binding protein
MLQPKFGEPLLEGRGLDSFYGQSHILRGVSVAIRPGETVGLVGSNCMGKTTLLRSLIGLVRPRQGSEDWRSKDVLTYRKCLRYRAANVELGTPVELRS